MLKEVVTSIIALMQFVVPVIIAAKYGLRAGLLAVGLIIVTAFVCSLGKKEK